MLTVLIATRNGAKTLPGVLEAYCRLESPRGGWKMVIVDNGSTDGTGDIIASFSDRLPLTYVFEPAAGKNRALNAGLAFVSPDLVALTDDDTFPRPDWLVRIRQAADAQPTYGIFGGAVLPRWETSPAAWLLKWVPLAPSFAVTNPDLREGPTDGHQVFGPNMAVRAEIFLAGHRFDPSIGPTDARNYPMGSETEFVLRMMRQGVTAWWVPTAVVDHLVRTVQMHPRWIIRRAARAGRGQCRLGLNRPPHATLHFLGITIFLYYEVARKAVGIVVAALLFDGEKLFHRRWALSYICGYALEARASGRRMVPR